MIINRDQPQIYFFFLFLPPPPTLSKDKDCKFWGFENYLPNLSYEAHAVLITMIIKQGIISRKSQ